MKVYVVTETSQGDYLEDGTTNTIIAVYSNLDIIPSKYLSNETRTNDDPLDPQPYSWYTVTEADFIDN